MHNSLYEWPAATTVGTRIPKEKIYEQARASTEVKKLFVNEIESITWAHKLSEGTINLTDSSAVPEIQVLVLALRGNSVSSRVLSTIDKVIHTPIIFEVIRRDQELEEVSVYAAHKLIGSGSPKTGKYYSTDWFPADSPREALPPALSLHKLYTAILESLTSVKLKDEKSQKATQEKISQVEFLEREIKRLKARIDKEKQLNRKIELRKDLVSKVEQLELLKHV